MTAFGYVLCGLLSEVEAKPFTLVTYYEKMHSCHVRLNLRRGQTDSMAGGVLALGSLASPYGPPNLGRRISEHRAREKS